MSIATRDAEAGQSAYEGGQVSELDVDQAQSLLSQTESQIPVLEISLRTANNQLCVLMGRPMINLEPQIGPANIPTAPTDVVVGIPADLLRRRPDVRRERLAAGQAARIGVAVSDWYPHISILGTLDYQAQGFSNICSAATRSRETSTSFQWNLLNYGRILNNVRATDALFQQLVVDYQNTVLVAQQETENGLITFVKSQEQAKDLLASVVAAQQAVVIALAQYKAGMIDFNRVSLLEQNLVTYQNQQAQGSGAIALGLIQTYRALGGGWSAQLNPTLENTPGIEAKAGPTAGWARTHCAARPRAAVGSQSRAAGHRTHEIVAAALGRPRRATHGSIRLCLHRRRPPITPARLPAETRSDRQHRRSRDSSNC